MKKVLISMMLVLLTLCLFVSCSSSPKVKEEPTVNSITYRSSNEVYKDNVVIFYKDGGGMIFIDEDSNNVWDVGENKSEFSSTIFSGKIKDDDGEMDIKTLTLYTLNFGYAEFYKTSTEDPIESWNELIWLDTIYYMGGVEINKIK